MIDNTQEKGRCSLFGDEDEKIDYIMCECSKEYKITHDWVGKVVHRELCKRLKFDNANCCYLQIRPVEEQLKQRVIGKHYCISRKRKSYKGSTSRARLAVRLSNIS